MTIVITYKFSSGKNGFKYFIGHKKDDEWISKVLIILSACLFWSKKNNYLKNKIKSVIKLAKLWNES